MNVAPVLFNCLMILTPLGVHVSEMNDCRLKFWIERERGVVFRDCGVESARLLIRHSQAVMRIWLAWRKLYIAPMRRDRRIILALTEEVDAQHVIKVLGV